MTTLNNIVDVTITRETRTIQRASFSIPCFIAEHTIFAERAKEYTSLADIVTAGFATTSAVYKAATLYFGQTVAPSKIIVGRRLVPSVTITPTVANTAVYSFKANGTLITFTSDGSATAAEIVTGLKDALTAAAIPTTGASGIAATGTTTLILTPSGDASSIANYTANLVPVNAASVENWVSATIPAVRAVKDQWYMLSIDSHADVDVLAVAAYIEGIKATSPKFYVFSSAASDIKTSATTDIFSLVKALSYTHTAYIYSGMATSFAECGLVGRFAPEQAGSNIWEQKTIVGLTVDTLTPDEINKIADAVWAKQLKRPWDDKSDIAGNILGSAQRYAIEGGFLGTNPKSNTPTTASQILTASKDDTEIPADIVDKIATAVADKLAARLQS